MKIMFLKTISVPVWFGKSSTHCLRIESGLRWMVKTSPVKIIMLPQSMIFAATQQAVVLAEVPMQVT